MRDSERRTKAGKRTAALSALIVCGTVRQAAQACGLSEATLYRYLGDPDFRESLRDAERQAVGGAVRLLQGASEQAADALIRNLHCENPAVEVRTAQIILEQAQSALERVDLEERLSALEDALKVKL
jgi:AcrR family transcriptional regulator